MKQADDPGFAILPGVVSETEVETLLGHLARSALPRSKAGARNALSNPAVARIARDPRLLRIASDALGAAPFPFKATLFDKSRGTNWLVVWHQDTALPLKVRHNVAGWGPWSIKAGVLHTHAPAHALSRIVALRLHLDDSTSSNGPLKVLPGTHLLGVLSATQILTLSSTLTAVDCLVPKGGLITMRPLLVHSSSKVTGVAPRRVLHVEYATSRNLGDALELDVVEQGVADS